MMVMGITREGRELRSGRERVEYKKDRGIDRRRQRSKSIDISSINTRPNGPGELKLEIDQKTEVSADVWKENIPLTYCEEGIGGAEE